MTTTARELAEKLVKNFELVHFIEDIPDNHPISMDLVSRIEIAINEAHQRGRESVLSRVPSDIEMSREYGRKGLLRDWILAKLKEPT